MNSKILYEDSPNIFKSYTFIIILFILISFISYGIPIIMYFIILFLQNISFKFTITNNKIYFKRGIFQRRTSFIKLKDIKDYEIDSDIFQEKFDFCDLIIYTAVGSNREIRVNGIKNKKYLIELLEKLTK